MILNITEGLRIETSAGKQTEFTIQQRHTVSATGIGGKPNKNAGKAVWSNVGYHGCLASALQRVVDFHLAGVDGDCGVGDVLVELRMLRDRIDEVAPRARWEIVG